MRSAVPTTAVALAIAWLSAAGGFAQSTDEPVVRIEATGRVAEETSEPLRRIRLDGEFTVARTGSTEHSLPVWILISGSAKPGVDYEPLPWLVTIPADESSVSFPVRAIADQTPEGIETVVASLSNCPPETKPPLGAPCFLFAIDPSKSRDTVFIRDDGITEESVEITSPQDGSRIPPGEPIPIRAVALDLDSYISRVEFWAGDKRIGVSQIYFVIAPSPGTPIHHQFVWEDAPPGEHALTARAADYPSGEPIVSQPVKISVGPKPDNQAPEVRIVAPAEGDRFPAGEPVTIEVATRDPDGFVPQVEFLADDMKIGAVAVNFLVEPPPGQPQQFEFTWENPPPGLHQLRARATDNRGAGSVSAAVGIATGIDLPRPAVGVVARDAFAVETPPGAPANTATFRIVRWGTVDTDLAVHYALSGRAGNGKDYEELSGTAMIPVGAPGVDVVVTPLADDEREEPESVILTLEEAPEYVLLSARRRAIALISDHPWSHPRDRPCCRLLRDRLVHFCFPVPDGQPCRLEISDGASSWATWERLIAVDGAVHYIEEAGAGPAKRFCRIVPE